MIFMFLSCSLLPLKRKKLLKHQMSWKELMQMKILSQILKSLQFDAGKYLYLEL